ncbi:MAG TPA: hypothetical protein DCR93_28910, partial [Cytophagales bacterium]|nr:hypothetical protein [Cytophagales bacterium]
MGYADAEGKVTFGSLGYTKEGIRYNVRPAGNPADYQEDLKQGLVSRSVKSNQVGVFVNLRQRTIMGRVANLNTTGGYARDSVLVTLYEEANGVRSKSTEVKTDHEGRFSFAIPYFLGNVDAYTVEVATGATDSLNQPTEPFAYEYSLGTNQEILPNGVVRRRFPKAELLGEEVHRILAEDDISYPTKVLVTGPGTCDVLSGYEFLLRIQDDRGKLDTLLWTGTNGTARELEINLPPAHWQVDVIKANKADAFSQAVLDYFRTRTLSINQVAAYDTWENAGKPTTHAFETYYFRYSERTQVAVTGFPAATCGIIVMDGEKDSVGQKETLVVTPTQTINGVPCAVTSGYLLARFPGGTATDATGTNDTIEYRGGAWEAIELTASVPNLSAPYTQLLEVYYYDAGDNFQGMFTQEILVTGKQRAVGSDVFVVPDANNTAIVPLYVLRDPPGDQSYSYIEEGSSFSFSLDRAYGNYGGLDIDGRIEGLLGGFGVVLEEHLATNFGNEYGDSRSYELTFGTQLSTSAASEMSTNTGGFVDGPDADVILGTSVVMAYGVIEQLNFTNCTPAKTRQLDVVPQQIKSIWAYTRSQIQNTVRYYDNLINGTPGNYSLEADISLSQRSPANLAD